MFKNVHIAEPHGFGVRIEAEEPCVLCGSLTKRKTELTAVVRQLAGGGMEVLDAQINPRGTCNVKHTGFVPSQEGMHNLLCPSHV